MNLRKQKQIPALASLSSPQLIANPFLAGSDKVPDLRASTRCRIDGASAAVMGICRIFESGLAGDLICDATLTMGF
jgi:hypothetical protein